jgi:hypothetical protein
MIKKTFQVSKPKLELLAPQSAATEKEIGQHVKCIKLAFDGNLRAGRLFFAYAAIAGASANRLADLLPHGELTQCLAAKLPGIPENTLLRWRQFARDLVFKTPTVVVLLAPLIGKKTLPAKRISEIQEAVLEGMDSKGMVDFMRGCKMLREPAPPGGKRGSGPPRRISDEDAAECLREEIRQHAIEATRFMEDQEALVRLMDDMKEFTKIRMVYHDLNQKMLEMERKANP